MHCPLLLLIVVICLYVEPSAAQISACLLKWQTTKAATDTTTSNADAVTDVGVPCKSGVPNTCAGINAQCIFSQKTFSYRCCSDRNIASYAAIPDAGPLPPDLVKPVSPRDFKPKCPMGALGFGGNSALTCNTSNPNAGCPSSYTCTKAENIFDPYNTPGDTSDDYGAADFPYVCCLTSTMNSYASVFTAVGLTPSIVPNAPTWGIKSVKLATGEIGQADDWSTLSAANLATMPTEIAMYFDQVQGAYYHVIMFDATTKKDVIFCYLNVGGVAADLNILKLNNAAAPAGATLQKAFVYFDNTIGQKKYKLDDSTYQAPTANINAHRFVVLVFRTAQPLPEAVDATDATAQINLKKGTSATQNKGDLDPEFGKYTSITITEFLKAKTATLGIPIAGTFFTLQN